MDNSTLNVLSEEFVKKSLGASQTPILNINIQKLSQETLSFFLGRLADQHVDILNAFSS